MRSPYEMTALKRVERAASNAMKSPGARRRLLGRCLDTRRRSSRSCVVSPSVLRPSSRSACTTQLRIDCADGSNSSANSSGLLPTRTSPKTSASASGASYRLCGVQTWGVLRFERPRTRVLRAQTGCFRSLYGSPGARFLTPGDTGAESARCAAGWAEAFGAVLSEAGSLDGTPDAEQSVDRGLPPDDP